MPKCDTEPKVRPETKLAWYHSPGIEPTRTDSAPRAGRSGAARGGEGSPLRLGLTNVPPLLLSVLCVGLATIPLLLFENRIARNLVPIAYLIPVIVAATRWGLWPAMAASVASVVAADFFFFAPLYSLRIDDPQEAVDLLLFLVVALVSSNLASRLRRETEGMRQREKEIHDLYAFSRRLAACFTMADLTSAIQTYLSHILGQNSVFFIPTADGRFEQPDVGTVPNEVQEKVAAMVARIGFPTQMIHDEPTDSNWLLKLICSDKMVHGVIAVNIGRGSGEAIGIRKRRVETVVEEASLTLQRLDIGKAMEDARLHRQTDRLRNAFLGSLSHELRSPLAVIQGSASVLQSMPAVRQDRGIHSLVEAMSEEIAQLDGFIQNLLNATRVTAGGIAPRFAWTDPRDIVDSARKQRDRRLAAHTVTIDLAENLPLIHVDSALVAEAYGQLLENAAKYSPSGSTISIDARTEGECVILSVSDQGIGITPDEQQQLGRRSFRGRRHRAAIPGSGLGFWIASTFVKANGGTIDIRSRGQGPGATASITLPVSRQTVQQPAAQANE